MDSKAKQLVFWVLLVGTALLLYNLFQNSSRTTMADIPFSQLVTYIRTRQIESAVLQNDRITGKLRNGQHFRSDIANPQVAAKVAEMLTDPQINTDGLPTVTFKDGSSGQWISVFLTWILPFLLFAGFWVFMLRQMQASGNKALSFGKSRARLASNHQKRVTFKDVAGVDEAKEELREIIDFLKDPQKFQKLGGRIPKGVLLMGPPGTGKTLLARAVAGEAGVPFFSISGSEFVEMFVGVGASRVRDLFEQAKKHAPCVVFIDEIDAVGRHRGAGLGGGHDEREQTLNQLLVEMDGFESNEGVILIAATNRPDVLDPALLRPGRFDRRIIVNRPDLKGREEILRVHTRKVQLGEDVDLKVIARGTPGFTGADLANLVNEAALIAARYNRKAVTMLDFEEAKDKVLMGSERRSVMLSEQEKRNTAYHEAGHTVVALKVPHADPIHKVTIIPRGLALGVTQQLPESDRHMHTREYLESQIAIMMGGRVAEEIFLGSMTTGASNDLERATEIAREMVCKFGMSQLGPLTFGSSDEAIFLGKELVRHQNYSEDTAIKIDQEVKRIVMEQYQRARQIIEENREGVERLVQALLEKETLDAQEIERLVSGLPLESKEAVTSPVPSTEPKTEKEPSRRKKPIIPPVPEDNPATA
ncbi:MAG TPA: ATP-dependent zinc metalloprotease FtsH [Blastocatellia bacterium]|nr:ATP-dependent zinc metalloprotease FtsH [Blastocatellia bacterium]